MSDNLFLKQQTLRMDRIWSMPSKNTFQIPPIKEFIDEEKTTGLWIDPFPFVYIQDALDYLKFIETESVDGVLFDPPYSLRQLKECYQNIGRSITGEESREIYIKWKDEISRVIKPGGKCLSFSWNSGGLGAQRGFRIIRIRLVPHGGNHNDTICVAEIKMQGRLC